MTFKDLEAWKKAMDLIVAVYSITRQFPKEEMYGLTSQLRRAATSVAANIAESNGRNYKKDSLQFLHIARGSLYETETLLAVSQQVAYISQEEYSVLSEQTTTCLKVLNGYIRYMENAALK
jgi:four helix bundle protein